MRKRAEDRVKVRDLEPGDIVLYDTVFPDHAGAGPEELTVAGVEVETLETLVHFNEVESPVAFDSHDVTIGVEQRANPKEDPEEHKMSNLKTQLIRLGEEQPSLRKNLKPILDEVTRRTARGHGRIQNHLHNAMDFAYDLIQELVTYARVEDPRERKEIDAKIEEITEAMDALDMHLQRGDFNDSRDVQKLDNLSNHALKLVEDLEPAVRGHRDGGYYREMAEAVKDMWTLIRTSITRV